MRILYVIDDLGAAGAERSLAAMAPHYARAGIGPEVAYLRDEPGVQPELEAAGAGLLSLEGSGGRLGWVRRARRLIRARQPDLVHTTLFESDVHLTPYTDDLQIDAVALGGDVAVGVREVDLADVGEDDSSTTGEMDLIFAAPEDDRRTGKNITPGSSLPT